MAEVLLRTMEYNYLKVTLLIKKHILLLSVYSEKVYTLFLPLNNFIILALGYQCESWIHAL